MKPAPRSIPLGDGTKPRRKGPPAHGILVTDDIRIDADGHATIALVESEPGVYRREGER